MARDRSTIFRAAKSELDILDLEMGELRDRQFRSVVTRTATGTGDIAHTFGLDRKFRLVFVRCHFTGTSGTAALVLSVDSGSGTAYDATLFTVTQAGTGSDVHLRIGDGDTREPSAWTFQTGDALRIDWANPDPANITWGLEVGLVLAS
ncbi:MAG: hypothetical protein ACE5EX_10420 [Phycisphaerae bacterium]